MNYMSCSGLRKSVVQPEVRDEKSAITSLYISHNI